MVTARALQKYHRSCLKIKSARIGLQAQKLEVFIYLVLKRFNVAKGLANIHYIL